MLNRLVYYLSRHRREEGQTLAIAVVMFVVLIGFAGAAIDVGNAWLHKRRLQSAVDLGVLSGAQKMPDETTAQNDAKTFVATNIHNMEGGLSVTSSTSVGCMISGCTSHDKLSDTSSVDVPTYFLGLFGIDKWHITAKGSACGPCDSSAVAYDVMIVLDRSYSMCVDQYYHTNGCTDMDNAVLGIKTLIPFFNPKTDYLGLTLLGSSDTNSSYDHSDSDTGTRVTNKAGTASGGCDTMLLDDVGVYGKGPYYQTAGDFMDGTPGNHDTWVVDPLNNDFKTSAGLLNPSSNIIKTLNCVQHKYWTPIAPAIYEARTALAAHNNPNGTSQQPVRKILIYFGDGGANAQPMKRDSDGYETSTKSWYTPTPGNNNKPCHDAIAQAALAKASGIEVYTIGYDLNSGDANACNVPNDGGDESPAIDAMTTMQSMATDSKHFYNKAEPGEVYSIFNAIGHSITSGGTRLVD